MKESEPFFNFSEKTPLFLVGLFTLIHFLTLFSSVPVDHGVLRPLHQSDIGVTSHTFRLFFHGFFCELWQSTFVLVHCPVETCEMKTLLYLGCHTYRRAGSLNSLHIQDRYCTLAHNSFSPF